MADKAKIPILVLIVLIIASLSLAGGIFYLYKQEQTKRFAREEELSDLKIKERVTEAELEKSKKKISALELQIKDDQTKIDTLTQQLEQEKAARQEGLTETEQLRTDLEQQKNLRSDLENKLVQAKDDGKRLQAQLKELESKKSELETKIKEMEAKSQEGVELGTIVVSPETAIPAQAAMEVRPEKKENVPFSSSTPKALEGKILVVNKEYNFVVINLGSRDGVDLGDKFFVYHNNKYIGDIQIEKIHDSMAAAGFSSPDIKDKVSEDDKVVQKAK